MDKLEASESLRKQEEQATESQPIVYGKDGGVGPVNDACPLLGSNKVIVTLFCDVCVCRNTTAHAHSGAQRGRASSAAVRLRLHSSAGLRPATTAQLRLRHVIDPHPPPPHPSSGPSTFLPSHHPSLSHQLPMVFYTQQGPQASDSPLWFSLQFFILFCYKRKTALQGLSLLLSEDKLKH